MSGNRADLFNPNFTRVLRGYSPKEVDSFLHEIADVMARQSEEKLRLNARIAEQEARIAENTLREDALKQTLVATQKMMEETKTAAQREAQIVMEAARNKADSMVAQAETRLNRVLDDIFEANKLKEQFFTQLRVMLEGQLKLLNMEHDGQEDILKKAHELDNKPGR
ncbi:DivIVA domain-containing protein [Desulfovibrio sp. OttesenSCG-928-F07]|nr:DivIVA domain-containing protein [Desulfovibrio sp. OttesenSCG-928-F07]